MVFKKMRGCKLTYIQQGLVRFVCLNYKIMPERVQRNIRLLCNNCADGNGAYYRALWDVLTTQKSVAQIASNHAVSERKIYNMRLAFYHAFYDFVFPDNF